MGKSPRKHSSQFKTNVVLDLIKEQETLTQICSKYDIHPTQAKRWKNKALENMQILFTDDKNNELKEKDKIIEELYKQIGQLKVEVDWLKKNLGTLS